MTQKVHVTWEDADGEEITNGTDGYIVNQGTVDFDNVQRSTLTITAARLKSVVEHEGRYTTWKCKVRSTQFPLSDMFGKDLIVEFPKYGETDRLIVLLIRMCVFFVCVSDVVGTIIGGQSPRRIRSDPIGSANQSARRIRRGLSPPMIVPTLCLSVSGFVSLSLCLCWCLSLCWSMSVCIIYCVC